MAAWITAVIASAPIHALSSFNSGMFAYGRFGSNFIGLRQFADRVYVTKIAKNEHIASHMLVSVTYQEWALLNAEQVVEICISCDRIKPPRPRRDAKSLDLE